MQTAKQKPATPGPWWLEDGDEECPHCGQLYHREVELRCVGCDAAGCRHCVLVHQGGHHCPECIDAPTQD